MSMGLAARIKKNITNDRTAECDDDLNFQNINYAVYLVIIYNVFVVFFCLSANIHRIKATFIMLCKFSVLL